MEDMTLKEMELFIRNHKREILRKSKKGDVAVTIHGFIYNYVNYPFSYHVLFPQNCSSKTFSDIVDGEFCDDDEYYGG